MKSFFVLIFFAVFFSWPASSQQTYSDLNVKNLKLPSESASKALTIDSNNRVKSSSVTDTELGYLSGATSSVQTQLNGKQATITGAATTITSSDLSASMALESNGSGKVSASSVTSTELGYVSGVTSGIQTQIGTKANDSAVVHLTGNETISGVKTLTGKLVTSSTLNGSVPCPVMTQAQRDLVSSPSSGDCVFNSTSLTLNVYDGSVWKAVAGAGGVSLWVTANAYAVNDVIIESDKFYRCLTAHTSGTFSTDLAALKWTEISNTLLAKSQVSSSVSAKELQVRHNDLTLTAAGKYKIETGNGNLLANPSFDHSTVSTDWTCANTGTASATITAETASNVPGELNSLKIVCTGGASGGTCSCLQSATTTAGFNTYIGAYVKSEVGLPAGAAILYSLVNGTRTTAMDFTNTASSGTAFWDPKFVNEVSGSSSTGLEVLVTSGISASGTVYVDLAQVTIGGNFGTAASMTNWYASVAQGTLQDSTTEIRFAATNPFTIKGDTTLLTYTDDAAGTRTKFVANQRVYVTASFGTAVTTTNSAASIYVNGAIAMSGSQIRTANDQTTVTWTGFLNAGEYLSFNAGTVVSTGAPVYAGITATAATHQTYGSQCGAACENSYSATVDGTVSPSTVSNENVNFINGNCTRNSTGDYSCPVVSGLFTVLPNITLTAIRDGTEGGTTETCMINSSSTTSSLNIRCKQNDGNDFNTGFIIKTQKQGADYISSRTIQGTFKDMMTAPGISKPKTCYATFGGAAATLASPVVCSTGTCIETYDSCGTFSPPAFSSTGEYTNFTFSSGTYANSSYVKCTCNAYDTASSAPSDCHTVFYTGDTTWVTNSSGGITNNVYTTSNTGAAVNKYVEVKCEGQSP